MNRHEKDKSKPKSKQRKPKPIVKKPNRVLKAGRSILISGAALLLIFTALALAYTYFIKPPDVAPLEVAEEDKQLDLQEFEKPPAPAADAAVGVSKTALTSPAEPGTNASLTVKTLQGATCDISVFSDEDEQTEVKDSGLTTKTANEYGVVSWAWTIAEDAPEGEWPIEVECTRNDQSGVLLPKLEVKRP